jgi:hypothetical protein
MCRSSRNKHRSIRAGPAPDARGLAPASRSRGAAASRGSPVAPAPPAAHPPDAHAKPAAAEAFSTFRRENDLLTRNPPLLDKLFNLDELFNVDELFSLDKIFEFARISPPCSVRSDAAAYRISKL